MFLCKKPFRWCFVWVAQTHESVLSKHFETSDWALFRHSSWLGRPAKTIAFTVSCEKVTGGLQMLGFPFLGCPWLFPEQLRKYLCAQVGPGASNDGKILHRHNRRDSRDFGALSGGSQHAVFSRVWCSGYLSMLDFSAFHFCKSACESRFWPTSSIF